MKVILLLVVLLSINIVQSIENGEETPFEDYVEDDFRILTFDDVENDGIDDEMPKDFQENTKILKTKGLRCKEQLSSIKKLIKELFLGKNINNLPYESYGKFDELKSLPPFPKVDQTVNDEEAVREKRSVVRNKASSYSNKMDNNIKDSPMRNDFPTNSKFHGFNVLNDFQDDNE